jgi:enoyl-CoA hydratase/carnithine racemase
MSNPSHQIGVSDAGRVRTILIDRAAKHNALTAAMMLDIAAAVRDAPSADASIVVIRSAGERVFCAGGDLDEIRAGGDVLQAWEAGFESLAVALEGSALPVVAIAPGRVMGGGIALLALADVVLASTNTSLDFAEFRLGLYPAMLHAILVPRMPANTVFQLCIGARSLSAQEALAHQLVTELLHAAEFAETVDARIAYYADRAEALHLGRMLRRADLRGPVRERLAAVAPDASRHFRSEAVRRLMSAASGSGESRNKA